MFISIDTREDLISEMEKNLGKEFVIHYNCEDCDDEQVTDWLEIEQTFIDLMKTEQCIYVRYNCTNCGSVMLFLQENNIQGIEY